MKVHSIELLKDRSRSSKCEGLSPSAWLSRVGSVSLIIGAASVMNGQARDVWNRGEDRTRTLNRFNGNASRIEKRVKAFSTSDLLTRQSDYRLPGQKRTVGPLSLLAGSDNCPGTPIPPGTYTAAAPYTNSGDTTGANNTVWNYGGGYYYSYAYAPDHIYSFTLMARGPNPRIEVSTTNPNYDLTIYVMNGMAGGRCPAGIENAPYAMAVADRYQPGGTEVFDSDWLNQFPLNVPLHLFIDSAPYTSTSAGPYTIKFQDVTIAESTQPPANDAALDMNGDGRSDFVIARDTGGQKTWYTRTSNDTFLSPVNWGVPGDIPVPANYDSDGKVDYAVWRPGPQGRFYIIRSQTQTLHVDDFGQTGDDPTIVADFTGDGLADPAVYRDGAVPGAPSYWYYRTFEPPNGFAAIQFGQHGDKPVPGHYFPWDTNAELVLRRADGPLGIFLVRFPWGDVSSYIFGHATDTVVPGDYDDDGITDLAVARVGNDGLIVWDFDPSATYGIGVNRSVWGVAATDVLAPGDYDGDGQTEFAVWRPGNPGTFFVKKPGTGQMRAVSWGRTGDVPVANSFVR
ncbi:MAG TPA: VCBS repeat-containing protein [Pyrinomonadaceae bacterium]|nr:VCBS repeat-containing protein [Pyrinomonadaceae bacterium]